jgi:hypothetical protein
LIQIHSKTFTQFLEQIPQPKVGIKTKELVKGSIFKLMSQQKLLHNSTPQELIFKKMLQTFFKIYNN